MLTVLQKFRNTFNEGMKVGFPFSLNSKLVCYRKVVQFFIVLLSFYKSEIENIFICSTATFQAYRTFFGLWVLDDQVMNLTA
jgi:hypothetical protein